LKLDGFHLQQECLGFDLESGKDLAHTGDFSVAAKVLQVSGQGGGARGR
jgi:hypothetical protein